MSEFIKREDAEMIIVNAIRTLALLPIEQLKKMAEGSGNVSPLAALLNPTEYDNYHQSGAFQDDILQKAIIKKAYELMLAVHEREEFVNSLKKEGRK